MDFYILVLRPRVGTQIVSQICDKCAPGGTLREHMLSPREGISRFLTAEMHPAESLTKHALFPHGLKYRFYCIGVR